MRRRWGSVWNAELAAGCATLLVFCLATGCRNCGEYRMEFLGQKIVLGPGEGQCVTFEVKQDVLDWFIKDERRKTEEVATDINDPYGEPVTPTGSMAVQEPGNN